MKKFGFIYQRPVFHSLLVIGLFLVSMWLPNPCSSETLINESQKNGLTVCTSSPVVSLDPTNYRDRTTQVVLKNIFDSLTTRDKDLNVVPQLAESWEALDETTWEFKLRRGVTFHNGDDFTAEDVKFTLERVVKEGGLDGKTSPRKGLLGPLSAVEIVDEYTVRLKTKGPWPILPLMLTLQEVLPSRYLKKVGTEGLEKRPVGTGPFRFARWEEKDHLALERFEGYYGGSPQNPPVKRASLDRLFFRSVPQPIDRIAMLKRGACDIITHVPPASKGILEMVPGVAVVRRPATRSYFAELNVRKPPLNERRVRLALNYAVDRQRVVDHVLQGFGTILPTVLLPNAFAYNRSLGPYDYKPDLARQLFTDSGLQKGDRLRIFCAEEDRPFANAIGVFLAKVGFTCTRVLIRTTERKSLLERPAEWDIFVSSWGNSTLDPVGILVPKFRSGGRGNYSGYSNSEVDRLLSEAEGTLNADRRRYCYERVQEIIYRDAPMIFGYAAEELFGVRERVQNFKPSLTGMMNMHDVYVSDGD